MLVLGCALPVLAQGFRDPNLDSVHDDIDPRPNLGSEVALGLKFQRHDGRRVELREIFDGDKPVIVHFLYFSCPMLCGEVTQGLIEAIRPLEWGIGDEFDVLLVSIDPRDTALVASDRRERFIRQYGRDVPDDSLSFLTADASAPIRSMTDAYGFPFRWVEEQGEYAHGSVIFVASPDGKLVRAFGDIRYPTTDLKYALVEAKAGRVGSMSDLLDLVSLSCVSWDPAQGKYTSNAFAIMRVVGVLTILFIGGVVLYAISTTKKNKGSSGGADSSPPENNTATSDPVRTDQGPQMGTIQ